MIIAIGIDIVDINRIKKTLDKYGKKFKLRCFSKNEINNSEKHIKPANSYAKRFAAKEACAKALGLGLAYGVFWKDITIENDIYGKPFIKLYGKAYQRLKRLYSKPCHIEVSLSDEKNYAIANIVIHKKNEI